jgi:hypothetical protein
VRRLLPLALALVVLLGVPACGDRTELAAAGAVRAALTATQAVETASVTVTLDGTIDARAAVTGRLDGTAAEGTVRLAGLTVDVRAVNGALYARLIGDRWVGVRSDNPIGKQAADVLDAGRVLDWLEGVGAVSEVGPAIVDGTATTEYAAELRVDEVVAGAPDALRERLEERLGGTVPVGVWVDGAGLLRRVTIDLPRLDVQLDVTDLGVPVDVRPPPADKVTMLG